MKSYAGWNAAIYNKVWGAFTQRTLAEAIGQIDVVKLREVEHRLGRVPRVLDIGCGTGILLLWFVKNVPDAEVYGVDASLDMLEQARAAVQGYGNVRLSEVKVGGGESGDLPYEPETFDLITSTNVFHDLADPRRTLEGIARLLAPGGQLVLEDYARRPSFVFWPVIEWISRLVEEGYVRSYTIADAACVCKQAGFSVVRKSTFVVDWVWHGWTLCLEEEGRDGGATRA